MVDPLGLWQFTVSFGPLYLSFGSNNGQKNVTCRVGAGGGFSASLDPTNTNPNGNAAMRSPGLHFSAGATASAGAVIAGGSAAIEYDGSYGRHGGLNISLMTYITFWTPIGVSCPLPFGSDFNPEFPKAVPLVTPDGGIHPKSGRFTGGASFHIGVGGTYVW
jgi:hypothetical protein